VGWTVLHRDVSMVAADRLIHVLDDVRCSDHDLQLGLYVLRRELHNQLRAGTPWRARRRLDVLATLDLPAWAALQAVLDECPVMLANVNASHERRRHTLNRSEFQFIATAQHIAAVHDSCCRCPSFSRARIPAAAFRRPNAADARLVLSITQLAQTQPSEACMCRILNNGEERSSSSTSNSIGRSREGASTQAPGTNSRGTGHAGARRQQAIAALG
jgi:hypothetical protein